RDGLFEKHVLARLEELLRHRKVQVLRRGRNVDRVDAFAVEELAVVGGRGRRTNFRLHLLEPVFLDLGEVELLHLPLHGERLGADGAGPADADHGGPYFLHWLTLMFASLISFEYLSISALMKPVNSAGVLLTATTPRSANFCFTSGSASSFTVSACSLSTTG